MPAARDPLHSNRESGTALILSLIFMILVVGIVTTGTLTLKTQVANNRTNFVANNQALMAARSGLTEAVSWLRRQTAQPVVAFEPALDTAATPPVLDTEDPDIGLVRQFRITGDLWARYEVWKNWPGDPDPVRLAWRNQYECQDISTPRAAGGAGSAWRVRSIGYIYRVLDSSVAFNVQPNRVLASEVAETEARRIVVSLPGQAAVNVRVGASCSVLANGRIIGGSATGIYYPTGPAPNTGSGSVTGSPTPTAASGTYDDSIPTVFGITIDEMMALADQVVTTAAAFPSPLPAGGLVIIDMPSLTITSANPLKGNGIVLVRGNLVLASGNQSLFGGLLYVDGNLTMNSPSEINGAVICTGTMTVQGSSDFSTINYDESALNEVMRNFGNYQLSRTTMLPRHQR